MKARRVAFSEQDQTKTLAQFTKTILVGGSFIVLPVYVSLLLLAKAVQALLVTVKPITAGILAAVEVREMLAILALAAVCFIAGLIVRTEPVLWAKNAVEEALLEKLPGYTLLGASPDALPVRPMNQALRRRSSRSKRHWFRL